MPRNRSPGPGEGPVEARICHDGIVVCFRPVWTDDDVDVVRRIPGRRWRGATRTWQVPASAEVLAGLRDAFGARLRVLDGTGSRPMPESPPPELLPPAQQPPVPQPPTEPAQSTEPARPTEPARATEPAQPTEPTQPTGGNPGQASHEPDDVGAELHRVLRLRGYSPRTARSYEGWVRRFAEACGKDLAPGTIDGEAFLDSLARQGLSAASRNQAAAALDFLFRDVLELDELPMLPRARLPERVPAVLSHREAMRVLAALRDRYQLAGMLLYSSGLRVGECVRLRLKDLDVDLRQILVRDAKGRKDRYVPMARRAVQPLRAQVERVREQHQRDLRTGHGWAALPGALHRKLPGAGYDVGWQWLFPATTINTDPASGHTGRWPLHVTAIQREIRRAVQQAGITKRATCHTLRHSFATETLRSGCDIRTLQTIMGHSDIRTTMIYLHVVEQTGSRIRSPLDQPLDDDPDGLEMDWPLG